MENKDPGILRLVSVPDVVASWMTIPSTKVMFKTRLFESSRLVDVVSLDNNSDLVTKHLSGMEVMMFLM